MSAPARAAHDGPTIQSGIDEYSDSEVLEKIKSTLSQHSKSKTTADHSKFKELQGPFSSGPEVTKACLSCHNKAGDQFSKNKHWTWEYEHPITKQKLGKARLVNNFCTNARGNEGMCAKCHAGYNRTSPDYDLTKQENMDCLVCHDRSGKYRKTMTTEGNKACSVMVNKKPIEWVEVAKSVGKPTRTNCGKCHFYGGGGDNVKHGDLSSALFNPDKQTDVHMNAKGLDFACTTCHVGEGHEWDGSRYQMHAKDEKGLKTPGLPRDKASCESCHSGRPHPNNSIMGIKLNGHTDKVACETCHIPEFAKGGVATKTNWDWRTAGKLKNGEGYKSYEYKGYKYTQGDGHHRPVYKSIKGNFKYAENMKPIYRWFNGTMNYTTVDTKFDPSKAPIAINEPQGDMNDPKARIWPFKPMHTIQPYDKGNKKLVYMHLWGNDDAAFWGNYDFGKAIKAGMKKNNKPYSGEFDFVETVSYWPINHMVAPKEKALACEECHSRNGRLAALPGFYMPGRDNWKWLDLLAYLALAGALGGVILHGLLRAYCCKKGIAPKH
jgi:octaheme c-type cytochrome (tetrathionate reductase family)